jgi:hypothetical protein
MNNNIFQKAILVVAISTVSFGAVQQPAAAVVSDPATMARLQTTRNSLLVKESTLLRDQDDLKRQIWDVKKTNEPQTNYVLNDLCQTLDSKYVQLQKTRWELKQIEQVLL